MARRLVLFAAILFAAAGCRTCNNPYDYCGPVVDSSFHPLGSRAGSVMAGNTAIAAEVVPSPISPPAPPTPPRSNSVAPDAAPGNDAPPALENTSTNSVMRPRFVR